MESFREYYDTYIEPKIREFDPKIRKIPFISKYSKKDINEIEEYMIISIYKFIYNDTLKDIFVSKEKIKESLKIRFNINKVMPKIFEFGDVLWLKMKRLINIEADNTEINICDATIINEMVDLWMPECSQKNAIFDGIILSYEEDKNYYLGPDICIRRKIFKPLKNKILKKNIKVAIDDKYKDNKILDKFEILYSDNYYCLHSDFHKNNSEKLENQVVFDKINKLYDKISNEEINHFDMVRAICIYRSKILIFIDNTTKQRDFINDLATSLEFDAIYKYYLGLKLGTDIINVLRLEE